MKLPNMINTKEEVDEYATRLLIELASFCKNKFNLPNDWFPNLILNYSRTFLVSRGGVDANNKPEMKIAARRFLFPVTGHVEYASFATNKVIGAFTSDNWRTVLIAIMSHEIAHCVQFSMAARAKVATGKPMASSYIAGLGKLELHHGLFFQRIYVEIRQKFVNPFLTDGVKGKSPKTDAVAPDAIRWITRDKTHPLVNKAFNHPELGPCLVTEYRVLGRKYKFTIQQLMTRCIFKISTERLALFGCE